MPDKSRWGVIGCGQIAIDKALPGVVAVADPVAQRRELAIAFSSKAGIRDLLNFTDADELLASAGIDAVYIALPTGTHCYAVTAAAHARKAILCEKPLG